MGLDEALSEYIVALRQMGRSRATIRQYGWHLSRLVAWLSLRDVVILDGVTRSLLRLWGAECTEGWGPATCKQAFWAVRGWCRWCQEEGLVECDHGSALRIPRVPRRQQRTLSVVEVRAMLGACDCGSVIGRRDAAVVSVLVDSGLRSAELCRLQLADVDVESGRLVVVVKGGDERFGYFGVRTADRLRSWYEVRDCRLGVGHVFVSVGGSQRGRGLTRDGLRVVLRRIGERAGVAGVSPHALRRSFATLLTEGGAPSRAVQVLGRWSNIQMVERYTMAVSSDELGRSYSAIDFAEGGLDR